MWVLCFSPHAQAATSSDGDLRVLENPWRVDDKRWNGISGRARMATPARGVISFTTGTQHDEDANKNILHKRLARKPTNAHCLHHYAQIPITVLSLYTSTSSILSVHISASSILSWEFCSEEFGHLRGGGRSSAAERGRHINHAPVILT